MDTRNEDCYFFYNSSCNKGKDCPYRHCVKALGETTVCTYWEKRRDCTRHNCPFRHTKTKKERSTTPCYHEMQKGGCLKPHCLYLHKTSRPNLVKAMIERSNKVILPLCNGQSKLSEEDAVTTEVDATKPKSKPKKAPVLQEDSDCTTDGENELAKGVKLVNITPLKPVKPKSVNRAANLKDEPKEALLFEQTLDHPKSVKKEKGSRKSKKHAETSCPSAGACMDPSTSFYEYNTGVAEVEYLLGGTKSRKRPDKPKLSSANGQVKKTTRRQTAEHLSATTVYEDNLKHMQRHFKY